MKILINQPGSFKKYKNKIGIVLYTSDVYSDFYDSKGDFANAKNTDLVDIDCETILKELNRNDDLRELAYHYDLIDIVSFDTVVYLNYVNIHN